MSMAALVRPSITLPVEIDNLWLDYLPQPDLLRVAAASKRLRAVVMKHKQFYICIRLCSIRNETRSFVRRIANVRRRNVQLSVEIEINHRIAGHSLSKMNNTISTELERSMHLVRRLSITLATPLAPDFLLYPAPALLHFAYQVDPYNSSCPDTCSSSESGHSSDSGMGSLALGEDFAIVPELFAGSAPKLRTVILRDVRLPSQPIEAFASVTDAALHSCFTAKSMGAVDLALLFPAAQVLTLADCDSLIAGFTPGLQSRLTLPPSLVHVYLQDVSPGLEPRLREAYDIASIPHLHVFYRPHISDDRPPFCAHVSSLTHLRITSQTNSHPTNVGQAADALTIQLWSDSQPDRSISFSIDRSKVPRSAQLQPFLQLRDSCDTLRDVEVPRADLLAVFLISNALPELRRLQISLDDLENAPFWSEEDSSALLSLYGSNPHSAPFYPQLEALSLRCDISLRRVASEQLADFGTAVRIPACTSSESFRRPKLLLRGVVIDGETPLNDMFDRE